MFDSARNRQELKKKSRFLSFLSPPPPPKKDYMTNFISGHSLLCKQASLLPPVLPPYFPWLLKLWFCFHAQSAHLGLLIPVFLPSHSLFPFPWSSPKLWYLLPISFPISFSQSQFSPPSPSSNLSSLLTNNFFPPPVISLPSVPLHHWLLVPLSLFGLFIQSHPPAQMLQSSVSSCLPWFLFLNQAHPPSPARHSVPVFLVNQVSIYYPHIF